jgi:hypothetical protein
MDAGVCCGSNLEVLFLIPTEKEKEQMKAGGLMRTPPLLQKAILIVVSLGLIVGGTPGLIAGQAPLSYRPAELDKLVSRFLMPRSGRTNIII